MVVALQYEWWQRAIIGALIFAAVGAPAAGLVPYFWSKSSTVASAPPVPTSTNPGIDFSGNRIKNSGTVIKGNNNMPTMSVKNNDIEGVDKIFDIPPDFKTPKK